jgi:mono/diheme cytochrome c family protein
MAEVVQTSTQHLSPEDARAMAVFLKALGAPPPVSAQVPAQVAERGARLYDKHCAQCHGEQGEGVRGAYPPLAGNRSVLLPVTANLVQVVLGGGFPPATAGNPRPFGMPPFVMALSDADVAAVLTHVRTSWGNQAAPVSELEVERQRSGARR